jgi:CubicO group peptidase (beta-lactamase class C family)
MKTLKYEAPATQAPWPTESWSLSMPEAQGMDAGPLEALDHKIGQGEFGYVDSMLVIRHGYVVYDKAYPRDYNAIAARYDPTPGMYNYYHPDWHPYYQHGKLHTLQSATKTVTSAILGVATGRGEFPPVDTPIVRFFDESQAMKFDARKQLITIEHLLTMCAGLEWDEASQPYTDERNNCAVMERSQDWVDYVINRPMALEPGTTFVYNSGATLLLSFLLKKTTGSYIDEYAAEQLFKPLGIHDFYWKRTPGGLPDTEGGLYLDPHDLAKIGLLYQHEGNWEGRQLIPREWVQASLHLHIQTQRPIESGPAWGYGYQWWLMPLEGFTDAYVYFMHGYGGQILCLLPGTGLITVFTGWNIFDRPSLPMRVFDEFILKAVKG